MKSRKGRHRAADTHKRSKDRRIVLLDQRPLRRKAASECNRMMARLERAKTEWRRFQQEDQTGYERWRAATFGALLSRLREIEASIRTKEELIREVEMEMVFGGARTPRSAYAKVQNRKDNPQPEHDPWDRQPPPPLRDEDEEEDERFEDPRFGNMPEIEQELLFEDFLRVVMGMNPDRMNDKKYEQMFTDFKAHVLGQGRPKQSPAPEPPKPEQNRIKEIYRLLVRRLHPDTRADSNVEVSALWHEVQEAYGDGNVERLDMLLAMTDLQANAAGEHTTLHQMWSVIAELRRSYNALQRNLRDAKRDPAWNFGRMQDRSALERRVGGDLKLQITSCERRLDYLESEIARWSAPRKARKKGQPVNQTDFFF